MKKIMLLGLLVIMVMAITINTTAAKIVIKFPTVHGDPNSLFNQGGKKIGAELEKLMPGVFDFQLYPGSQLGNEREILEGLRIGTLEMTTSGVAGIADPIFNVFDLPFLFKDRDEAYSVLDGEVGQELLKQCQDKKLVALGYFENGWRHITNNVGPINKPSDLDGLRQRVVEHQIYMATMNALGAGTVPIPYGELYTALKTGVVDGQDNPLVNIYTAKFYEVQDYLTLSGHVYSNNVIFASRHFWDKLTVEQQAAIREAVQRATEYVRKLSIANDNYLVGKLTELGVTVNTIEDKEPFVTATESVYNQFSELFPPELIERIRNTPTKYYPYNHSDFLPEDVLEEL